MTFHQWLARRHVTLTDRGDLIAYLRRGRSPPARIGDIRSVPVEFDSIYQLLGHLVRNRLPASAAKAARGLWREYAREVGKPVW
jgi:hypothetical protein